MAALKPYLAADPRHEKEKGRALQVEEVLEEMNPATSIPIPLMACMYMSPSVSHSLGL